LILISGILLKNKQLAKSFLNYLMFFSKYKNPKHVLVCREDAMGDVILAMPVCGLIKKHYPGCKVSFLGRTYTRDVASCCAHIDEFLNYYKPFIQNL